MMDGDVTGLRVRVRVRVRVRGKKNAKITQKPLLQKHTRLNHNSTLEMPTEIHIKTRAPLEAHTHTLSHHNYVSHGASS